MERFSHNPPTFTDSWFFVTSCGAVAASLCPPQVFVVSDTSTITTVVIRTSLHPEHNFRMVHKDSCNVDAQVYPAVLQFEPACCTCVASCWLRLLVHVCPFAVFRQVDPMDGTPASMQTLHPCKPCNPAPSDWYFCLFFVSLRTTTCAIPALSWTPVSSSGTSNFHFSQTTPGPRLHASSSSLWGPNSPKPSPPLSLA